MSDLRAWDTFDAASQATLRSGGTVTGGDGRKFVLINGHATVVGSPTYTAGMAARAGTAAAPAPAAPVAAAPNPASPAPDKGGWMSPSTGAGVVSVPVQDGAAQAKTAAQRDALALIRSTLAQYGLPDSLADWAWSEIQAGKGNAEIMLDLQQRPEFKTRFPAIDARRAKGLPALSPGEYVAYENTATQVMRAAGIPKGFWDSPDDFTKFLTNDMSVKELSDRVDLYRQELYQKPAEVRAALREDFGLTEGEMLAWVIDPDKALPMVQRLAAAADIGGASRRTGYRTTAEQDYRLTDLGVTADQAQSGFNALGRQRGLFDPLLGHNETQITVDEQLGAAFGGNVEDDRKIEKRRQDRIAEFGGGGSYAGTNTGMTGIGRAT